MPEGPEIRRIADRLGKVLSGQQLTEVWFAFEHLKSFEPLFTGQRVVSVNSWGKALLTSFDDGHIIYSHNQLYGRWAVGRIHSPPQLTRSLRLSLSTARHVAQLYSASDISIWHADTLQEHPFLSKLGPDLLTHAVTRDMILDRLQQRAFARKRLGGLLLDQHFLAGIGNYLRSEILFFAGILPKWRACDVSLERQQRLADVILEITHRAYDLAGVTNTAAWRELLKARGMRRAQWRHAVFNRAGEPCHACGTGIEKIQVASRRLYFCPHCQH